MKKAGAPSNSCSGARSAGICPTAWLRVGVWVETLRLRIVRGNFLPQAGREAEDASPPPLFCVIYVIARTFGRGRFHARILRNNDFSASVNVL